MEKGRKLGRWAGKGMLFFQPDQGERLREGNKSIPFWLKRGWRYSFWKKRPQMRALSGKRYAFSRNRGLAAAAAPPQQGADSAARRHAPQLFSKSPLRLYLRIMRKYKVKVYNFYWSKALPFV